MLGLRQSTREDIATGAATVILAMGAGRRAATAIDGFLEPEERLRGEVWGALRDWLAETESPLVLAETADDGYLLRPAG